MRQVASAMSAGYIVALWGGLFSLVHAQVWNNRPGTVYACPDDDVTLPWQYIPSIARDVTMVHWRHVNTSRTVAVHHLEPWDRFVVYNDQYRDRVSPMPTTQANAGIVLEKVAIEDAGSYKVALIGTGFSNTATLNIVSDSDLETVIIVDGEPVTFSSVVYRPGAKSVGISVSTCPFLKAAVLIATNDRSTNCIESTVCNTTVTLDSSQAQVAVTVAVYYGICQPREYTVYIQTEEEDIATKEPFPPSGPSPSQPPPSNRRLNKGEIAGIVIAVVIVALLAAAITVWILFYRKKSKGYVLKPWQRKYVNCKVFIPFKKSKCFKDSTSTRGRSRSKNSSVDHDVGSSVRDLDREFRTLTKEDITVVYDDSPGQKLHPPDESYQKDEEEEDEDEDHDYSDSEYDEDIEYRSNRLSKSSEA